MEKSKDARQLADPSDLGESDSGALVLFDALDPAVEELFSSGKVCLSKICQSGSDGYTVINPLGTNMKVLAVSGQAYTDDHIGKTVACIGIRNSSHVMIVGEVSVPESRVSVLDQLIDGYQESKTAESNGDVDIFTEPMDDSSYSLYRDDIEEELVFEASRNILFRCGDSSISLSADGRVHIRGKFVTNSASQLNRVSGGTVKIN